MHRLVAEAFIPNPLHLPIINHKDENPSNNNANNLEWCTYEYNANYGTRNKKVSDTLRVVKKDDGKKVMCVETGITYESLHEAERQTGVSRASINRAIMNKLSIDGKGHQYITKTAGGYHWAYVPKK